MAMSDRATTILALDSWQGREDAEKCPNDQAHGKLAVHGSGSALLCAKCGFNTPVDSGMVTEALAFRAWKPEGVLNPAIAAGERAIDVTGLSRG